MAFDFQGELVLPVSLRRTLGKVYGRVVTGRGLERTLRNTSEVYAIGDVVVATMLRKGMIPRVAIFDNRTGRRRHVMPVIKRAFPIPIRARSRAGTISKGLWNAVAKASERRTPVAIEVEGEEDLASLACIHFARNGAIVAYGLRGKGINVLKVDKRYKSFVLGVFRRMKEEGKVK